MTKLTPKTFLSSLPSFLTPLSIKGGDKQIKMPSRKCKSKSDQRTNSLATISEAVIIGHAKDADIDLRHQPKDFTVLIIGDEDGRIRGLTQTIASPCVMDAIASGDTVTVETITQHTWRSVWGNKALKTSKSGHTHIGKKTIKQ